MRFLAKQFFIETDNKLVAYQYGKRNCRLSGNFRRNRAKTSYRSFSACSSGIHYPTQIDSIDLAEREYLSRTPHVAVEHVFVAHNQNTFSCIGIRWLSGEGLAMSPKKKKPIRRSYSDNPKNSFASSMNVMPPVDQYAPIP